MGKLTELFIDTPLIVCDSLFETILSEFKPFLDTKNKKWGAGECSLKKITDYFY